MRLWTLILLSSVAVAIVPHMQVERATPGEEGLGLIPAVAARSLYWLVRSQYNVTDWDRSHGLPALSRVAAYKNCQTSVFRPVHDIV